MRRSTAARLIQERLKETDVVVCGLGSTARAWRELGSAHLTYYASDPMGMAPSLALGLALARPDRRIVLLEGDGDLTMNLGVLVTIAGAGPPNLRIAVFVNERYETGGGQPLPNAGHIGYARIAEGAGFPWSADARDEASATKSLTELLTRDGLGLVAVRVEAEASPYPAEPGPTSQAEDRARFQRRLADG